MTAVPDPLHLTIYQGTIFAKPFAMQDDTGEVQDYTGWSGTLQIFGSPATVDSIHNGPLILSLTSDTGAVNLGKFDGGEFGFYSMYIYLTQAQTSALNPWGTGVMCVDLLDPMGHPQVRIRVNVSLEEGTKHG